MGKNFNEVLKERERIEQEKKATEGSQEEMSLDSTERIKVLSPGQMVFKRFINNKLAIVGSIILIFMFLFSFVAPLFYPYSQTEIFYKYDDSIIDYAQVKERTEFSNFYFEDCSGIHYSVMNNLTANITSMLSTGNKEVYLSDKDGNAFKLEENTDKIFSFYRCEREEVCTLSGETKYATYSVIGSKLEYEPGVEEAKNFEQELNDAIASKETSFSIGNREFTLKQDKKTYNVFEASEGVSYVGAKLGADFEKAAKDATGSSFEWGGNKYTVTDSKDSRTIYKLNGETKLALLSTYVFDAFEEGRTFSDEFKRNAIEAVVENGDFEADGVSYSIVMSDDEMLIYDKANETNPVAVFSNMVIRRYTGEDTLEYAFKEKTREIVEKMMATNATNAQFTWPIAQVDENGEYTYDENGELIKTDREITVVKKKDSYTLTVAQVVYLIDTFATPSKEHWVGTDGDGMDVLSRMMYGGRVSLMVAFVVVIIENILGIIMGGIAGFFGGWVDNLIMRLVDIFYCIPSMPILIILGAMFDALKLRPYVRITWLMVVLGILGWAGTARLVRGQILSLREQEFMVAAEAVGLKTKHRIFRHLVPNVMPQLIVTATSGLGGVIITESTLSYLGLGVKHPLATWGTMINSVSTAEAMKSYTYIWIPVGLLICLTVVAFNFVGDGLRDAFDPKMKR